MKKSGTWIEGTYTCPTRRQYLGAIGAVVGIASPLKLSQGRYLSNQSGGESWPQFQKDTKNTASAPMAPAPISDVRRIWRRDTGGGATPAVVGDVVFAQVVDGVSAFSVDDGTELWTFEIDDFGGTLSISVVDGSVYFAERFSDSTQRVFSLSADDGSKEWRFHTPEFVDYIRSPVTVSDQKVIFGYNSNSENNSEEELGGVLALSAANGQEVWRQPDPRDGQSSTVGIALAVADGVVHTGGYALSVEDGSTIWTNSNSVDTSPTITDGSVFCVHAGGWVSYSIEDGSVQWMRDDIGGGLGSPAVSDGVLYLTSSSPSGDVYALDANDGSDVWHKKLEKEIHYGPIVANGTVYIAPLDGPLFALEADSGSVRWTYGEDIRAEEAPVIARSNLYYPTSDGLDAITGNGEITTDSTTSNHEGGGNPGAARPDQKAGGQPGIQQLAGDHPLLSLGGIVSGLGALGILAAKSYQWWNEDG